MIFAYLYNLANLLSLYTAVAFYSIALPLAGVPNDIGEQFAELFSGWIV